MKVLKKIGIILGILLVLFLVLGFFMPKEVHVSKTMDIDAPANYVFNIVNDVTNEEHWNSWSMSDTTMALSLGKTTLGEGASYSWTSENSGNGAVTYTDIIKDQKIEGDISFDGDDGNKFSYQFKKDGDETEMTYDMDFAMSYPSNVFAFVTKMFIKKEFKKSMAHLADMAEKRYDDDEYFGHKILQESLNERHFVMNRDVVSIANVQKFYAQNLGSIFRKVQEEGLSMNGMPCGLFFKTNETKGETDMAAAIPVIEDRDIKGLSSLTLPAKSALVIEYYGDYAGIKSAHVAMDAYLKDNNLFSNPPVIEEYVTDPLEEKDPSKWLTKVIYYY